MKNNYELTLTIPRKRSFKNVYQLKITLLGRDVPVVWRKIMVPESYTFYDLHIAIQDSMGWKNYHLHMFEVIDKINNGKITYIECPSDEPMFFEEEGGVKFTTEIPINKFLKNENDVVTYKYDFGDGWKHEVLLEKILTKDSKIKYPICLDGEMSCPPEDCGGSNGYYRCIESVKNQNNDEGLLDWLGDWKPDSFNPKNVVFNDPKEHFNQVY